MGIAGYRLIVRLAVHEAFAQRLAVRYHLGPLDLQETIGYIKHQLRVAGASQGTLITDDALTRVFDYTKGIPRRINQVCTTALMAARIDQKTVIEESTLRKAIAELDHE
jgi:general secretion pathway protein A